MMVQRSGEAGVTLIEMLAALAVSALIGVAGFTLLESVLQTETHVAGRHAQMAQTDQSFQILAIDLQQANSFQSEREDEVTLGYLNQSIVWRAGPSGLERRIVRAGRKATIQTLLPNAARLTIDQNPTPLLRLDLPDENLWRVFLLPQQVAR